MASERTSPVGSGLRKVPQMCTSAPMFPDSCREMMDGMFSESGQERRGCGAGVAAAAPSCRPPPGRNLDEMKMVNHG